jgi:hypothetical protein
VDILPIYGIGIRLLGRRLGDVVDPAGVYVESKIDFTVAPSGSAPAVNDNLLELMPRHMISPINNGVIVVPLDVTSLEHRYDRDTIPVPCK